MKPERKVLRGSNWVYRPVDRLFPNEAKLKRAGLCPFCKKPIDPNEFVDEESYREYTISGLCQACQNMIWPRQ